MTEKETFALSVFFSYFPFHVLWSSFLYLFPFLIVSKYDSYPNDNISSMWDISVWKETADGEWERIWNEAVCFKITSKNSVQRMKTASINFSQNSWPSGTNKKRHLSILSKVRRPVEIIMYIIWVFILDPIPMLTVTNKQCSWFDVMPADPSIGCLPVTFFS